MLDGAETKFELEQPAHGGLDARRRDVAAFDGGHHRVDRATHVGGLQQDIRSGEHGEHGAALDRVAFANSLHGERIRHGESAKMQRIAKEAAHDPGHQRGRDGVAPDCRQRDVGRHDAGYAGRDRVAKWDEFHGVETGAVAVDDGKGQM